MEEKIVTILNEMSAYLSIPQMKKLQEVVLKTFSENELDKKHITNEEFLKMFLDARRLRGVRNAQFNIMPLRLNICLNRQIRKLEKLQRKKYALI